MGRERDRRNGARLHTTLLLGRSSHAPSLPFGMKMGCALAQGSMPSLRWGSADVHEEWDAPGMQRPPACGSSANCRDTTNFIFTSSAYL